MTNPILAAIAVWACVLAVGWHYLVAPLPRLRRRRSTPRTTPRTTPSHRDPTMTRRLRPHLLSAVMLVMALVSSCSPRPLHAQTKDQKHQRTQLDSLQAALPLVQQMGAALTQFCATKTSTNYKYIRAVCPFPVPTARLIAAAMKSETTFVALYIPVTDTQVVVSPPPTPPPPTPAPAPAPPPAPAPAPSSAFAVPAGLGGGVAAVAELPRDTAATPYPTMKQQVRLSLIANLQAALNSAQPGDEILLPPGATFTGDFMLPKHAGAGASSCSSWIVLRTDVPDSLLGAPGTRMTPSRAAALKLARIQTPDNQQAIGSAWNTPNVGCWRLVGLEILPAPNATDVNGLVRFGDHNETDSTHQAHHLVLDRSYVHGSASPSPKNATMLPGQVRRCVLLNSRWNVVVDSWLEYCRGGSGDTQCILGYAGTGPYRLSNSTCSGGTEVVMWGGANGGIVGAVPSDITVHGNLITRELADTITLVKNLYESKNSDRSDVAGNVLQLNWMDGQDGSAVNAKSVNQSSGPCVWCHTGNFTFRDNRVTQSGSGLKLAGIQEAPALPAGPYTVYGNWIDSLGFRSGEGRPLQIFGGGLSDVTLAANTVTAAPWGLVAYDGGPTPRQVWQSNVLYCGGYGAKGNSTPGGTPTLTAFAPGAVWTGNALFGCSSGYPSGSSYASSLAAALASGAGADAAAVNAATRNAVVPR